MEEIRPTHYKIGIETWDFIVAWGLDFFEGNIVKYISRAGHKTPNKMDDYTKVYTYAKQLQTHNTGRNNSPEAYSIGVDDYINSWNLKWSEGKIIETICMLSVERRKSDCDHTTERIGVLKEKIIKDIELLIAKGVERVNERTNN